MTSSVSEEAAMAAVQPLTTPSPMAHPLSKAPIPYSCPFANWLISAFTSLLGSSAWFAADLKLVFPSQLQIHRVFFPFL